MNKDEELIFDELEEIREKRELQEEAISTFIDNVKGMTKEELEEVIHKERMYQEIMEALDNEPDDFYMDYGTYEGLD